jgi:hypothetical protein
VGRRIAACGMSLLFVCADLVISGPSSLFVVCMDVLRLPDTGLLLLQCKSLYACQDAAAFTFGHHRFATQNWRADPDTGVYLLLELRHFSGSIIVFCVRIGWLVVSVWMLRYATSSILRFSLLQLTEEEMDPRKQNRPRNLQLVTYFNIFPVAVAIKVDVKS